MAAALPLLPRPGDTIPTAELNLRRCGTCGEEFPSDYLVCPRDATPLGLDRDAEDPLLGIVLAGTYRIVRNLGRGGMGRLYEAQHTRLERLFAVKVLHEEQSRSKDAIVRFDREARVLSRIRSDHVLDVVDVLRTPDQRAAIITDRLEGEDLKARLDRVGKLDVTEAVPLIRQVCRGLAAAHAQGIIHRDLKPSNLFLESGADGRITMKILDFGVAKLAGEPELTRAGAVLGTPAYMAPEQARGSANVDERADIYALGAVLYRMLTGRAPFSGDEPAALLLSVLHETPERPRVWERSIPVGLEALIQRAMSREPAERPRDALELERELAGFDSHGDAQGNAWEPSGESGDVDTLVLPRGAVARAETIGKRAARARPIAMMMVIACSSALAAFGALFASAIAMWDGPAEPFDQNLSWLAGGALFIGAMTGLTRFFSNGWASAPDVMRKNRMLGILLSSAIAVFGAVELVARTQEALDPAAPAVQGSSLFVHVLLALLGGLAATAITRRRRE